VTYIPDDEPYLAFERLISGVRTVAIGWLDDVHPYRVGPVDPDFLRIVDEARQTPSLVTAGIHSCELCLAERLKTASACTELIFVSPDASTWYVAPDLISHYVTRHTYSPPDEFVAAVLLGRLVHSDELWGLFREAERGMADRWKEETCWVLFAAGCSSR
jgi:hypothetical protein